MNKELLVKVWIFLSFLTLVMSVASASFNFYTISGSLFIFHILVVVSGIVVSLFSIKQKIKFSKHLLVLNAVILLVWLIFILFSGCFGCGPPALITKTQTQAISLCTTQMQITCRENVTPPTWKTPSIRIQGNPQPISCFELTNCSTCQECGFTPS